MAVVISVPKRRRLAEGVWEVDLQADDLAALGKPVFPDSGRRVVFVTEAPEETERELRFSARAATAVASAASGSIGIVICVAPGAGSKPSGTVPTQESAQRPNLGDTAFFSEIADADPHLQSLAKQLVAFARTLAPKGRLEFAPNSKRWVESPNNFWSIKVQPRAGSVSITMLGRPEQHARYSDVELKQDRGSYSRFLVVDEAQLASATRLIRAAFDRSRRY